jgi:hypothetical protein
MGDRSAEMLNIMIAIIAVVALMALGFAIFTISKRMANSSQNDLVNQLDGISKSMYTDLDQQLITGARLKQVVNQASSTDCAIIVETLGFLGAQLKVNPGYTLKSTTSDGKTSTSEVKVSSPEATLNGNVGVDFETSKVPVVQLDQLPLNTSLGTTIANPYAVNFGSILKNSITGAPTGTDGATYTSPMSSSNGTAANLSLGTGDANKAKGYDENAEYNQQIRYKDGQFTTKLEFATNSVNSRILRYDMTSDFSKSGKTFSIPDTAQYNSYVLVNASGDYMGLVFCQIRK